MNRFEIATLRILFKTQNPIPISRLVDGFPSDYEDSVLEAITNLFTLGYILYPDVEKPGSVTYNKVKGSEILKIMNPPLPELPEPKVEVEQAMPPKKNCINKRRKTTKACKSNSFDDVSLSLYYSKYFQRYSNDRKHVSKF